MEFTLTEIIGYLASLFVLLSFFNKDLRKLRIVNSVGCALFVAYGIMLPSIPVIITNVAILMVNGYYLFIKKEVPMVSNTTTETQE
ncbi:YgjV family protein [Nonlabens ponticola]|uniref:Uroporphyrinogen decarboxylase n=1 Tax=Nonlabens ponticola TaxID=2496866 RepID=A0A3S9MZW8_9FLAO|nr:YgjV family protein [Nonlabens ponticola]AZQ44815.1 uroporphyrinogen decarboxylase [Nonlabens ponticola]